MTRMWTSRGRVRSQTLPRKAITASLLSAEAHVVDADIEAMMLERPKTRGDCVGGPRPCPWVSCKHHLALEVTENGHIRINQPDRDVHEMRETCSLDVADRGGATLEIAGEALNLTREAVRQTIVRIVRRPEFVDVMSKVFGL